jgi:hypothetical protein
MSGQLLEVFLIPEIEEKHSFEDSGGLNYVFFIQTYCDILNYT